MNKAEIKPNLGNLKSKDVEAREIFSMIDFFFYWKSLIW